MLATADTNHMRQDPALKLFRLFGVTTRLIVFQRVARRPQTASDIAMQMPISRSAVVQHLTVLKAAGLVDVRSEGRRRIYSSVASGITPLERWVYRYAHGLARSA